MDQRGRFFFSSQDFQPAYLNLLHTGELAKRAEEAIASLENCEICPRGCRTNRLAGYTGTCLTGRQAVVSSAFPHLGEEDCLRGWRGSGTIFFSQCGLRCVFCQNYDISQTTSGRQVTAQQLADFMLFLQNSGCHNINFVTPDHVVPQILEALLLAAEQGLRLPLVYNTSAYTSQRALQWLDSVIDIYMPDFKMSDRENARIYLKAKDYAEIAESAIREMHRQVGDLLMDENGLAKRGVLVRHLVMPTDAAGSDKVMRILADISSDMYVNIMAQYRPAGKTAKPRYARINRPVTMEEVRETYQAARKAGLWRFDKR